jgi:hypothetical protein
MGSWGGMRFSELRRILAVSLPHKERDIVMFPIKVARVTLISKFLAFEPVGNLHSYKFTELTSLPSGDSDIEDSYSQIPADQDWALIRIQPPLYSPNTFQLPGCSTITSIEGFVPNGQVPTGSVYVLSAISGVCEGYLSPGSAYWMFGKSYFEVRMIYLDKELSKVSINTLYMHY